MLGGEAGSGLLLARQLLFLFAISSDWRACSVELGGTFLPSGPQDHSLAFEQKRASVQPLISPAHGKISAFPALIRASAAFVAMPCSPVLTWQLTGLIRNHLFPKCFLRELLHCHQRGRAVLC
jgi:hypothetical protein